jgi:hypothetical protein
LCATQCLFHQWLTICDHGRDLMVVGFTTTYAISAYHHWCCEFESRSGWGLHMIPWSLCKNCWFEAAFWQHQHTGFSINIIFRVCGFDLNILDRGFLLPSKLLNMHEVVKLYWGYILMPVTLLLSTWNMPRALLPSLLLCLGLLLIDLLLLFFNTNNIL